MYERICHIWMHLFTHTHTHMRTLPHIYEDLKHPRLQNIFALKPKQDKCKNNFDRDQPSFVMQETFFYIPRLCQFSSVFRYRKNSRKTTTEIYKRQHGNMWGSDGVALVVFKRRIVFVAFVVSHLNNLIPNFDMYVCLLLISAFVIR